MSCILYSLFEGVEEGRFSSVGEGMRQYIGKSIYSICGKTPEKNGYEVVHVQQHEIVGLTNFNLREITVEDEPVQDFFLRKFNFELIHLEMPGFLTTENQLIFPELCHISFPLRYEA
jgi:hypothetical protein